MRRTQLGNNNAYCQDSELSWLDWRLVDKHADIHRFVKLLNAFRGRRDVASEAGKLSLNRILQRARIKWHGVELGRPDWGDDSHSLAVEIESLHQRFHFYAVFNAYSEPLTFQVPALPSDRSQPWRRCIDTALASPEDACPWVEAPPIRVTEYRVAPRSVVVLVRAQ